RVGGGHARPVGVQQAGAQQADLVGARREGLARGGQQVVERLFEVAAVVAVVQPPGRDLQVRRVPVQRQQAQQAQARVAGFAVGDAGGGVVVAAADGAARQEGRLRQFVPGRGLEGGPASARVAAAGAPARPRAPPPRPGGPPPPPPPPRPPPPPPPPPPPGRPAAGRGGLPGGGGGGCAPPTG